MPKQKSTKRIANPYIAKVIKLKNPKPEPVSANRRALEALAQRFEKDGQPVFSNRVISPAEAQKKLRMPKRDKQTGKFTKRGTMTNGI
jgi:hypothetical protein